MKTLLSIQFGWIETTSPSHESLKAPAEEARQVDIGQGVFPPARAARFGFKRQIPCGRFGAVLR